MTCYLNKPLLAAVVVLALYAVIVFTAAGPRTLSAGLLLGFYLLLVLNSYFSISFPEAVFRVRCPSDTAINVSLVAIYLGLPWLVRDPLWFFVTMAVFFCLAVIKYANWLTRIEANFFLRRKIMANALAGLECLLVVAALQRFQGTLWPVVLALILYICGTVHTLLIDPLYRER